MGLGSGTRVGGTYALHAVHLRVRSNLEAVLDGSVDSGPESPHWELLVTVVLLEDPTDAAHGGLVLVGETAGVEGTHAGV